MDNPISWTNRTWNPVTGCAKVSEGCKYCYAELKAATRLRNVEAYQGTTTDKGRWTGQFNFIKERLAQPLTWRKPARVFVNSMSDLFGLAFEEIAAVFGVMALAPWHEYQILTKRPERARAFFDWLADSDMHTEAWSPAELLLHLPALETLRCIRYARAAGLNIDHATRAFIRWLSEPPALYADDVERRTALGWPLHSVWLGVSVEADAHTHRIDTLASIPAALRWVSFEPLIGRVNAASVCWEALDWIVVGGESGKKARPMHPSWAGELLRAARDNGVPPHFKQWGSWVRESVAPQWPTMRQRKAAAIVCPDGQTFDRWAQHRAAGEPPGAVVMLKLSAKLAGALWNGALLQEYPR